MSNAPETPDDVFDGVERAIDLIASGDLRGAASEYRRLAARAPRAPEVIVLEGMLALHDGASEEAVRAFEKAASLDPTYALPLILAAETYLVDLDDAAHCLEFCGLAARVAGSDDERAQVLLLEADAWSTRDQDAEVRKRIERLAALDIGDAVLCVRAANLALDYEDLPHARAWFTRAIRIDPTSADAWHGLGIVFEAQGDRERMVEAWLETLALDGSRQPPPWHMSQEAFERAVEDALVDLPAVIRDKLADVAVLVENAPDERLVRDGVDPRLLGLFSGTPTTERGTLDAMPDDADTIRLFQRNIEASVEDGDQLLQEIRITLIHETAHYFGLEDADLEGMGLG